jgi:hypothetical protein
VVGQPVLDDARQTEMLRSQAQAFETTRLPVLQALGVAA